MKLEIKTKCTVCGTDLDWYHEVSVSELVCCVKPCPTCHPAKPEKVTPKEGGIIEAKYASEEDEERVLVYASGTRNTVGLVEGSSMFADEIKDAWDQWRYPGEKEWRD